MAAPLHAYPIGQPSRESGDPHKIAKLKELPNFVCNICGHTGPGEDLLGVDNEDTLWCPKCRSSNWYWSGGAKQ